MKENIDTNNISVEEKQSSNIISRTKEGLSNSLDEKFIKRIEFLMKLEELEGDVDEDSARIIGGDDIQRLSPRKLHSFAPILNEYMDVFDNEILKKLYYLGFTDFALQHIDMQKCKSDKNFSIKLVADGHIDLLNFGNYFERKLVDWLIESEEYDVILNNIDKFKIGNQYIINMIIDQGGGDSVCKYSKQIREIAIHQTAERMEKHGVRYKDIYSFIQRYKSYLNNVTTD